MKESISTLIVLVAENDDQLAFKSLFRQYRDGLMSYASGIVHDKNFVEEVVNDVFVKLWNNRKTLPVINNLSYYLYTATKHTALNYLKKHKSRFIEFDWDKNEDIFTFSSHLKTEDSILHHENLKHLENAINTLPEKCRSIFRLIREEGLKYKEVADLLNLSVKTVEAHMTLAYSRIVEALEEILPATATKKVKRS